jgi:hypothetical protein
LEAVDCPTGALDGVDEGFARIGLSTEVRVEGLAARPVDKLALVPLDMKLVIIGIGVTLEPGPDDRLRL